MIPVTSFRRKEGRRVRARRLGAGERAGADRGRRRRDRLRRQRGERRARRARPASPPPICARIDWSKIAALVLAPGVPLTHPAPHWSVGARAQRRRRGDRRHRAVLPRAAQARAALAVRRHHRHQRQIDHHGADRTICCVAPAAIAQLGGNIGTAMLSLEPPRAGPRPRDRMLVLPDRSRALARSAVGILINVSEDHLDRHGTLAHYAAVKERLVAGVQADGTAVIGVDDDWCARRRRPHRRDGQATSSASRCAGVCRDGIYVDGERDLSAPAAATTRPIADLGGIGSLRGRTMRRTPPARPRPRSRSASTPRRSRTGCARFPVSRTAWSRSAARARCCSSTIPRRPTRIPRRRRWPASTTSSGSPAASRRPAASPRSQNSSRASARPI